MNGLLKMYLGIVACSLVGVGSIHAQSETDAFSLSRTEIDHGIGRERNREERRGS